jgi:hypothetical protein
MNKQETEQAIQRLVEYLQSNKVTVEFNSEGDNAYYPIPNMIRINTRQNVKSRYYSLLHEVGHYLLRQKEDFSTKYLVDHSFSSKNKDMRIDVLREEIAAWDRALEFVQAHKYPYEEIKWNFYSKKFIYQYANWVVNPAKFIDD